MNRNDRAIVGLVMLAHAMVHTYELSIPIFVTIWLAEFQTITFAGLQIGVTRATLGLIVTAGYGLFGLGALPGGVLVDRVGSRRLIAVCLFGMGGAFLLLGAAPGLVAVAVALLVWGAAASLYHPAGLTLLSKGVERRGTGFAYHGVAGNLGIGLGPLATAVLLLVFDWTAVATLLAVPALAAGLYAVRAQFDETAAVAADGDGPAVGGVSSLSAFLAESKTLFSGLFVAVFAIVICSGLYYRGVLTFMPDLLAGFPGFAPVPLGSIVPGVRGGRTINPERYAYSGLLVVGVLGQYTGGKLTDRIPIEYGIVATFSGFVVVALLFLPLASLGVGPLLVLGAALGFVLFSAQPFYQAAVAEYTPAGTRGLSYGYTYLGVFGVGSLGGAVAGAILTYANPQTLFFVLAGFGSVSLLVGLYLVRVRSA